MRIEDVHDMRLKRAEINHATYKQLFDSCCGSIKRRAGVKGGLTSVLYQVPPFVWGRPPYEHSHALRYVSEKLRRNGFQVTLAGEQAPGTLRVEWTFPKRAPVPKKPAVVKAPKTSKLSARLEALRKQLA